MIVLTSRKSAAASGWSDAYATARSVSSPQYRAFYCGAAATQLARLPLWHVANAPRCQHVAYHAQSKFEPH